MHAPCGQVRHPVPHKTVDVVAAAAAHVAAVPAVWWGTDNVLLYESLYDSTRLRADVHEAKLILVGDAAAAVGGESTSSK